VLPPALIEDEDTGSEDEVPVHHATTKSKLYVLDRLRRFTINRRGQGAERDDNILIGMLKI